VKYQELVGMVEDLLMTNGYYQSIKLVGGSQTLPKEFKLTNEPSRVELNPVEPLAKLNQISNSTPT
jgi:hypothetical protein